MSTSLLYHAFGLEGVKSNGKGVAYFSRVFGIGMRLGKGKGQR